MIDITPPGGHDADQYPFLDSLLRDVLPEVKLSLGELIDRENARSLPTRYARLLPDTLLVVTLRPDAADVLAEMAPALEAELTDSCTRHGSLYDRSYRVQLRRAENPNAPLYRVSAVAGKDLARQEPAGGGSPAGHGRTQAAPARPRSGPHADLPAVRADRERTQPAALDTLPSYDPDATRIEGAGPPGWQPGRWLLLVENEQGEQQEVFRITDPLTTVGRRSDDPELRTSVAISDAPHVSRRQLALLWEERDGAPGFRVFNLGLNPVHLADREVAGAHVGKGPLRLDDVDAGHQSWLPPGVALRIGDRGPVLRIEEVEEEDVAEEDVAEDPDATVYE